MSEAERNKMEGRKKEREKKNNFPIGKSLKLFSFNVERFVVRVHLEKHQCCGIVRREAHNAIKYFDTNNVDQHMIGSSMAKTFELKIWRENNSRWQYIFRWIFNICPRTTILFIPRKSDGSVGQIVVRRTFQVNLRSARLTFIHTTHMCVGWRKYFLISVCDSFRQWQIEWNKVILAWTESILSTIFLLYDTTQYSQLLTMMNISLYPTFLVEKHISFIEFASLFSCIQSICSKLFHLNGMSASEDKIKIWMEWKERKKHRVDEIVPLNSLPYQRNLSASKIKTIRFYLHG